MLSNMHCYAECRGASEIPTNTYFRFVQNKLFLFYLFLIFFQQNDQDDCHQTCDS